MASLRVPRHFPRRFPLFSGPRGAPPLPSRSARLAHVTARRAARGGEGAAGADPDACAPRSVPLPGGLAWCHLVDFMRFLIWKGDCIDESRNSSFSPDALALPLPAGSSAWFSTPPLSQNGGRGYPFTWALAVPRGEHLSTRRLCSSFCSLASWAPRSAGVGHQRRRRWKRPHCPSSVALPHPCTPSRGPGSPSGRSADCLPVIAPHGPHYRTSLLNLSVERTLGH